MKVLSIINLKGGVAKTISSVNMAHILAAVKGCKVLLIDNDKQGNASKILNRHSYDHKGTAEVMTQRGIDPAEVIQHTDFDGLDIITANMNLLTANLEVMLDQSRPQQTRFKKFLDGLQQEYDYCIIDNAPDINISTINALVASQDVMVPITIDDFAIDGLAELKEQILKMEAPKAEEEKKALVSNVQVGLITESVVESVKDYGAFVRLSNGLTGLVHVSQISDKHIKNPRTVLKEGDTVKVKVIGIKDGKISLSMKALNDVASEEIQEEAVEIPQAEEIGSNLGALLKGFHFE